MNIVDYLFFKVWVLRQKEPFVGYYWHYDTEHYWLYNLYKFVRFVLFVSKLERFAQMPPFSDDIQVCRYC